MAEHHDAANDLVLFAAQSRVSSPCATQSETDCASEPCENERVLDQVHRSFCVVNAVHQQHHQLQRRLLQSEINIQVVLKDLYIVVKKIEKFEQNVRRQHHNFTQQLQHAAKRQKTLETRLDSLERSTLKLAKNAKARFDCIEGKLSAWAGQPLIDSKFPATFATFHFPQVHA